MVRGGPGSILLVLATGLAGCLDSTGSGLEGPLDNVLEPLGIQYSNETYLPQSARCSEPGIDVAPDGTLYVNAPCGPSAASTPYFDVGQGDTIWRSDDGGASFQKLPSPDAPFGGADSDVAVGADGTLYHSGLYSYSLLFGDCNTLSRSKDKGKTWESFPLACAPLLLGNDRNWIAVHGSDVVYLTFGWNPTAREGLGHIALTRVDFRTEPPSTNTITYFEPPDTSFNSYQWPGNIAVDQKTGYVYIAHTTTHDRVVVLRSIDGGKTLTKSEVSNRAGDTFDSFGVVTVGQEGTVYVTWSERDKPNGQVPESTDIFYAYSTDHGAKWSEPRKINSFRGTHIYPWIEAGEAGHLAVAWYGTKGTGNSAEHLPSSAVWHVFAAESRNANQPEALFDEVRASQKEIARGVICTSGTDCGRGSRDLLDFFQVALDSHGTPHLAWATKGDGLVKVGFAKQLIGAPASAPT